MSKDVAEQPRKKITDSLTKGQIKAIRTSVYHILNSKGKIQRDHILMAFDKANLMKFSIGNRLLASRVRKEFCSLDSNPKISELSVMNTYGSSSYRMAAFLICMDEVIGDDRSNEKQIVRNAMNKRIMKYERWAQDNPSKAYNRKLLITWNRLKEDEARQLRARAKVEAGEIPVRVARECRGFDTRHTSTGRTITSFRTAPAY